MSVLIPEEYREAMSAWLRELGAAERKALAVGIAIGRHESKSVVALLVDPRISVEFLFEGNQ